MLLVSASSNTHSFLLRSGIKLGKGNKNSHVSECIHHTQLSLTTYTKNYATAIIREERVGGEVGREKAEGKGELHLQKCIMEYSKKKKIF